MNQPTKLAAVADQEWSFEARIAAQRKCVALHISLENAHQPEEVVTQTFATEGTYYDVVPGVAHFEGKQGLDDFYEMLFNVLPDLHIRITHEHDLPHYSIREGIVTGTHSAEFAGVPPSGKPVSFPFCGMYIFGDDPTRLIAERAYWDNDGLIRQMRDGEQMDTNLPWEGKR